MNYPAELPKDLTKKKDKRIAEARVILFHIALDCVLVNI